MENGKLGTYNNVQKKLLADGKTLLKYKPAKI